MIRLIEAHPDHRVMLGIDSLGKEELLVSIAHACQTLVSVLFLCCMQGSDECCKVCVCDERLAYLKMFGFDEALFTTNAEDARVVVVPRWSVMDLRYC